MVLRTAAAIPVAAGVAIVDARKPSLALVTNAIAAYPLAVTGTRLRPIYLARLAQVVSTVERRAILGAVLRVLPLEACRVAAGELAAVF